MHHATPRRPTIDRPGGSRQRRRFTAGLLATGLTSALALTLTAAYDPAEHTGAERSGPPPAAAQASAVTAELQVLAFNDLHGALEPPAGSDGEVTHEGPDGGTETIEAGGVEYLASALREARADHDRSVTVAAGDMIGASPLLSGLFHDEPTIEALNALEMDAVGVGNHEFDEGWEELLRLQNGGCHPDDGCYVEGREFEGADFPYLAANVVHEDTGEPILPPYTVRELDGVEVGFIGVTLEGTADIVTQEGIEGLEFLNEAETLDRYAEELRDQGVNAVIALIHEGGYPEASHYDFTCDGDGGGLSGPITDIARDTSPLVDVLITGHTHLPYVCAIPDPEGQDRLVTSAQSNGRLVTELTMEYDFAAADIVRASVAGSNQVVRRDRPAAPDLTELIGFWSELAEPVAREAVGWISDDLWQDRTAPESPLGDLIADAQLAHARGVDETTELALMNPGGIRADLTFPESGDEGDGVVTYGEAFAVQPFGNYVQLMDLTGEHLLAILREQVSADNEDNPKILQPSEGLSYTLDLTLAGAERVVEESVTLHGEPLDPERVYRVAANSFLAGGGDGFPTFAKHQNSLMAGGELDALAEYLSAVSDPDAPLDPPPADRITVTD